MKKIDNENSGLKRYVIGYGLSLAFTLTAFAVVMVHTSSNHAVFRHEGVSIFVLILALLQFVAQLVFFLCVGQETKPRWKLMTLLFSIMVAAIIFIGSLWIMYNLNYNMKHDVDQQIMNDEMIHKSGH